MKIINQTFILITVLLMLPLVLFGQAKSITKENYQSLLTEARTKTEKQIRKRIQIQKLYSFGKLTGTLTDTTEYLPPDKSRWTYVEDRGNNISQLEVIRIGNVNYRRENKGSWIEQKREENGFGISGTDNSTREYFIENETIKGQDFHVLVEKKINYNKTFFDEKKVWIDKNGLIQKEKMTTSMSELSNIVSAIDITYDYKIKSPKIEAPIKK